MAEPVTHPHQRHKQRSGCQHQEQNQRPAWVIDDSDQPDRRQNQNQQQIAQLGDEALKPGRAGPNDTHLLGTQS